MDKWDKFFLYAMLACILAMLGLVFTVRMAHRNEAPSQDTWQSDYDACFARITKDHKTASADELAACMHSRGH